MQIVYQTDPEKYEYLNSRVEAIVSEFVQTGPAEEDLAKIKEYLHKTYKANQRENSYWAGVITNYLCYGADIDTNYEAVVDGLTVESVKNCLKSVLEQNNYKTLVMLGTQQ